MTTRRDRGPSPDPKQPASSSDVRAGSGPSLEELKALANATIYGGVADRADTASHGADPRAELGSGRESMRGAAARDAGHERATPSPRPSHTADRVEAADRLPVAPGAQRTQRPPRSASTSAGRTDASVRAGASPPRPELTPGTSVVLSELRSTLAERRDEVFSMALEPTESSEVDHYLRGRTQGLSEALLLLEQRLVDRANHR